LVRAVTPSELQLELALVRQSVRQQAPCLAVLAQFKALWPEQ
jgi:hypothetical protein